MQKLFLCTRQKIEFKNRVSDFWFRFLLLRYSTLKLKITVFGIFSTYHQISLERKHKSKIRDTVFKFNLLSTQKHFLQSDWASTCCTLTFWKNVQESIIAQKPQKCFLKYYNILTYLDWVANKLSDDIWLIRIGQIFSKLWWVSRTIVVRVPWHLKIHC